MNKRGTRMQRNERGVAMVTVMLVGAALTAVASVASFAAVQEFGATGDDRKAAAALAYSEAGIDRFIGYLRSGLVDFEMMNRAGCEDPALTLPPGEVDGSGIFRASMTVYDPDPASGDPTDRFPKPPSDGACASRPDSPHPGQSGADQTFFVITSEGRHPEAARVVRQVIAVEPVDLPVGLYANNITMQSAKHPFYTISMISENQINNRKNISFIGNDPYYFMGDFFAGVTGRSLTEPVPAAAHALTGILLKKSSDAEFQFSTKNCAANGTQDGAVASQSLWDSDGSSGSGPIADGCDGQSGHPNSSVFTQDQLETLAQPKLSEQDHQILKEAAQRYGVYCSFPGAGGSGDTVCIKQGVQQTGTTYDTYIEEVSGAPTRSFIAYFEYRSGVATDNALNEGFTVWPCDDVTPANHRSVVVIVRNGGVNFTGAGGHKVNGAFLVDGNFSAVGSFEMNGTIVAGGELSINSSSQDFSLDDCWVETMPGPFLRIVPTQWSEVDR